MKAVLSPLELLDFVIINNNFKFIPPDEDADINSIFKSYEIDIDFAIHTKDNHIRVFVKSAINKNGSKFDGYSIFAEGVALFKLPSKPVTSEKDTALLNFTALSIALNSLRGFILTLTANAPLGKYVLPSINAAALFKEKQINIREKLAKKKKVKSN